MARAEEGNENENEEREKGNIVKKAENGNESGIENESDNENENRNENVNEIEIGSESGIENEDENRIHEVAKSNILNSNENEVENEIHRQTESEIQTVDLLGMQSENLGNGQIFENVFDELNAKNDEESLDVIKGIEERYKDITYKFEPSEDETNFLETITNLLVEERPALLIHKFYLQETPEKPDKIMKKSSDQESYQPTDDPRGIASAEWLQLPPDAESADINEFPDEENESKPSIKIPAHVFVQLNENVDLTRKEKFHIDHYLAYLEESGITPFWSKEPSFESLEIACNLNESVDNKTKNKDESDKNKKDAYNAKQKLINSYFPKANLFGTKVNCMEYYDVPQTEPKHPIIHCKYRQNGCTRHFKSHWEMEKSHLDTCIFKTIECRRCGLIFPTASDEAIHYSIICKNRSFPCIYCGKEMYHYSCPLCLWKTLKNSI